MRASAGTIVDFGLAARALTVGLCSALLPVLAARWIPSKAICAGLLLAFTWVCLEVCYRMLRQEPMLIWSPTTWFILASGAYFGIGPMIYFVGDAPALEFCNDVWPISWPNISRVTLLNAVGLGIFYWSWALNSGDSTSMIRPVFSHRLRPEVGVMICCYAIGIPARAWWILYDLGYISAVPPGIAIWVGGLCAGGLTLLTTLAIRRGGSFWLLLAFMLGLEIWTSLLVFSKMAILMAFVPCAFGYLLARPSVRAVVVSMAALAVVYLLSVPYVDYSRLVEAERGGETAAGRWDIFKSYLTTGQKMDAEQTKWKWLLRLNYANVQSFAMDEYREGRPGGSFKLLAVAWIPRAIWPDKPSIESGRDFYWRLTGEYGASFAPGMFAEAYWNGGWLFLILTSFAMGWLFRVVTTLIITGLSERKYWILPIALLWIRVGYRPDGWFHTEVLGPALFTFLYVRLLRFWLPAEAPSRRAPFTSKTRRQRGLKPINKPAPQPESM